MPSSTLLPIVAFLLGAGAVGGILAAAFYPRLAGSSPFDRRLQAISALRGVTTRSADGPGEKPRKLSVEDTLPAADEQQKAKTQKRYKPSLTTRLRQADVGWSRRRYHFTRAGVAAVLFLAILGMLGLLPAAGFVLAGELLLPHLYVRFTRPARFPGFLNIFPHATAVIVRII